MEVHPSIRPPGQVPRPRVAGKFFAAGDSKLYLRGVTYGTFAPGPQGEFPPLERVELDFGAMAAHGINSVRTYTPPSRQILDLARRHGLLVLAGLNADDPLDPAGTERRVRASVRACAGHPALMGWAVGNEIPAARVRWLGARAVERFITRMVDAVRDEDPGAPVTYVNYPSTEYLALPCVDFLCCNVYLESTERLEAYLARLQNLAGERPVVMGEMGLDSARHGELAQARTLESQVRTAFAAGCAGAFVYAWTDEWWRSGTEVRDWDFGLVRRDRSPKPALAAVRRAFAEVPFPADVAWPRISVVVCSYNGSRTLTDCMEGLARLEYPDYEVIVVDDGSTDTTSAIAGRYDVRLLRTTNRGLSAARNTGIEAATGEIVAYTDDDARPDPHWLHYLAWTFLHSSHVGVGGPNLAPAGDGTIAECVAQSPGGPVQVLLTDTLAEHVPGCNMSFRRSALQSISGFDPRYRTAGDDVDLCWRLQDRGGTIGFHAGGFVWHHRRNSLRTYWRQQRGYGRAEALLEGKWPQKYNGLGHYTWAGRLYGQGLTLPLLRGHERLYGGTWGAAPFQSVYSPGPGLMASLPLMPEWYLAIPVLVVLAALGSLWPPLLWALPVLVVSVAIPVAQAVRSALHATYPTPHLSRRVEFRRRSLTAALHLAQPIARLVGRLAHGLAPWRLRGPSRFAVPQPRRRAFWSERWRAPSDRLAALDATLRASGAVTRCGGDWDPWDLEVRGGALGSARTLLGLEEHGNGRQMVRVRVWPRAAHAVAPLVLGFAALSALAWADHARFAATALATFALLPATRTAWECGIACRTLVDAWRATDPGAPVGGSRRRSA